MRCSDYVQWIAQKLEGTLPRHSLQELAKHLTRCNRCRAELALQIKIHESLMEEMPSELTVGFTRRVSDRILEISRPRKRAWRLADLTPAITYAVSLMLLFMFRADLVRALPPLAGTLSNSVGVPLVWVGERILVLLTRATDFPGEYMTSLEMVFRPLANILTATGLACVAIFWAFHKVLAFMRH